VLSSPTAVGRTTVWREWTVNFAAGPFQEIYLSEIPRIEGVENSVCREVPACQLYRESSHAGPCSVLQGEIDIVARLARSGQGQFATSPHFEEERAVSNLCPCSCPSGTNQAPVGSEEVKKLAALIDEIKQDLSSNAEVSPMHSCNI